MVQEKGEGDCDDGGGCLWQGGGEEVKGVRKRRFGWTGVSVWTGQVGSKRKKAVGADWRNSCRRVDSLCTAGKIWFQETGERKPNSERENVRGSDDTFQSEIPSQFLKSRIQSIENVVGQSQDASDFAPIQFQFQFQFRPPELLSQLSQPTPRKNEKRVRRMYNRLYSFFFSNPPGHRFQNQEPTNNMWC